MTSVVQTVWFFARVVGRSGGTRDYVLLMAGQLLHLLDWELLNLAVLPLSMLVAVMTGWRMINQLRLSDSHQSTGY